MKKSVTMNDVATAAGVSKGTVSNAFNRPNLLAPGLLERVREAAREVGYHGPDPKGRMLSSGRYGALGVVMPGVLGISHSLENPYARTFLSGVSSYCEEQGVALTLVTGAHGARECGAGSALVDGFILHGVEQAEFIEPAVRRKQPVVVIDYDPGPEISSIRSEDRAGGWLAARHLLQLGHRRLAIASTMYEDRRSIFREPSTGPRNLSAGFLYPTTARIAGISDALNAAGLSIGDLPIIETSGFTREQAHERGGVRLLFDRAPEVTGIICLAGHLGHAVLDEARWRGVRVPSHLSVVSFGGGGEEEFASPPLTVVRTPVFEKGRTAARLLLDGGPAQHLVLPFELVVRASTAPPPQPPRASVPALT